MSTSNGTTAIMVKALRVILSCTRPVQLKACMRYLQQVDRSLGKKSNELWMLYYATASLVQRGEELPW